jgi:hypothetical protein
MGSAEDLSLRSMRKASLDTLANEQCIAKLVLFETNIKGKADSSREHDMMCKFDGLSISGRKRTGTTYNQTKFDAGEDNGVMLA